MLKKPGYGMDERLGILTHWLVYAYLTVLAICVLEYWLSTIYISNLLEVPACPFFKYGYPYPARP